VTSPDSCPLTIELPTSLGVGQCVQLTRLSASPACPQPNGSQRIISFDVTAHSSSALLWRLAAGGGDAVTPSSGPVIQNGTTTVTTSLTLNDTKVAYEVIDASGRVVMKFTVRHR